MRPARRVVVLAGAVMAATVVGAAAPAVGAACTTMSATGWVDRLRATAAFTAPAGSRAAAIDRGGTTTLPSGRLLTPAGTSTAVGGHPYGLTLSRDGRTAITSNSGSVPFSLSVVTDPAGPAPVVRTVLPRPAGPEVPTFFMGLAVSPDGLRAYAAGGASGTLQVVDLATATVVDVLDLDGTYGGRTWQGSVAGDLALSADGSRLVVVDQANFRLVDVAVSPTGLAVRRSIPTGRYPFSVALAPDGKRAWVAATGTYEYQPVKGFDPASAKTALSFPPFGAPTAASRRGAVVEGKSVPPLGDPNDLRGAAVWGLDVDAGAPFAKVKTGPLVGQAVGGFAAVGTSGPDAVVTDGRRVWVSNGHSDTIAVLDATTGRVTRTIPLRPSAEAADLRGVQPFGLALSPDRRTLFVAESGLDAVAVVDVVTSRVLGHIPTGWLPSKVAVAPDGTTLYVANARGFGNGPNAALGADPTSTGAGRVGATVENGTLEVVPLPDVRSRAGAARLAAWTRQVLDNAGLRARGAGPIIRGRHPVRPDVPVKHVVVVVKENRTFDQVLGDVGAVRNRTAVGDAALANAPVVGYGEHATVAGGVDPTRPPVLYDVDVTPNHHALARTFAFSDNAYADGDVSADGHRWLVGVQPDAFVETSWPMSYGGGLSYSPETGPNAAPGRRGVTAAQAALAPEEYAEAGSIWEQLQRAGKTFYNFGEGLELADSDEAAGAYPTGAHYGLNTPLPAALFAHSARDFPEFNTTISDQYRQDVVEKHLRAGDVGAVRGLPELTYVWLPQDHGGTPSTDQGYPYLQSFPADNDLALGRLVDTLSHRPEWPSTAVFVVEDDPQGGFDHVDAHRTLSMVISPWAKRGYVSGDHSSTSSVVKTIELLLGMPMLGMADATSGDLLDMFTDTYDGSAYRALPSDPRLFDPAAVRRLGQAATASSRGDAQLHSRRIDSELDRPAGQPGGAVVRVRGQVVDESSQRALRGLPPRPVPAAAVAEQPERAPAACAASAASVRGDLAATGLIRVLPLGAVLLVAGAWWLRRQPRW